MSKSPGSQGPKTGYGSFDFWGEEDDTKIRVVFKVKGESVVLNLTDPQLAAFKFLKKRLP